MYLSTSEREMLETTLLNLRFSMDRAKQAAELWTELSTMTDTELEVTLTSFLADL